MVELEPRSDNEKLQQALERRLFIATVVENSTIVTAVVGLLAGLAGAFMLSQDNKPRGLRIDFDKNSDKLGLASLGLSLGSGVIVARVEAEIQHIESDMDRIAKRAPTEHFELVDGKLEKIKVKA